MTQTENTRAAQYTSTVIAVVSALANALEKNGPGATLPPWAKYCRLGSLPSTSAGTIYHHFANKNEIVLAVARRTVVEPLAAVLATHPGEGTSPSALFRSIVETVISGEVESALIVQLWAGSSDEPQLKEMMRAQTAGLRVELIRHLEVWLLQRGVPEAAQRAEALAMLTLGQAMGLLAQRTLMPELDQPRYVTEACRMLDAVVDDYAAG